MLETPNASPVWHQLQTKPEHSSHTACTAAATAAALLIILLVDAVHILFKALRLELQLGAHSHTSYSQYNAFNKHLLHCRASNQAEGELIRRKAAEEAADLAAKEAAWRAKALQMNAATKAANDTLLAFRAAEQERDKQLEEAVEGAVSLGTRVKACLLSQSSFYSKTQCSGCMLHIW